MKTKLRLIGPILLFCIILAASVAGGWLWYDNNVDRSGWFEKDGIRYYRDFHADPVSGWMELDGKTYCFDSLGIPYTGWQEFDGVIYYFDDQGAMVTGWQDIDGKRYYFGGNGAMVAGWLWLDTDRYYLDEQGAMVTGWQILEGNTLYFHETGIMASGFTQVEGNTYYFDTDGIMATGMTALDDKIYNFQSDGVMYIGWETTSDGDRYFHEDGPMAIGWTEIDGQRCYFNEEGYQQHGGWLQEGEYRYYIHDDGTYAVGPTEIDGRVHYFTPKGIEVTLVNAINPLPEDLEQTFVNVVDYHDVDARCYDALVQMLADYKKQVGVEYTFNSAYRTLTEQTTILEYRTLEHMRDYKLSFLDARKKALETVAIPGTSEHQLGLSVDLVGKTINDWLAEHCWEYGFILRYPKDKQHITGITNEPWHFRYVGREVSMDMKDSGLCLEEYLGASPVTPEAIAAVHGDRWYQEVYTTVDQEIIDRYVKKEE